MKQKTATVPESGMIVDNNRAAHGSAIRFAQKCLKTRASSLRFILLGTFSLCSCALCIILMSFLFQFLGFSSGGMSIRVFLMFSVMMEATNGCVLALFFMRWNIFGNQYSDQSEKKIVYSGWVYCLFVAISCAAILLFPQRSMMTAVTLSSFMLLLITFMLILVSILEPCWCQRHQDNRNMS